MRAQIGVGIQRRTVAGHLQAGVLPNPLGIVAVLVAQGDAVHTLPEQVEIWMIDPGRIPRIDQLLTHSFRQPDPLVQASEQHHPAIRALPLRVELCHHRLGKLILEQNRLSCRLRSHGGLPTAEPFFFSSS